MMKKLDKECILLEAPSNLTHSKNLNIRQSIRKKILVDNDPLLKLDVHSLFVENFNVRIYIILYRLR